LCGTLEKYLLAPSITSKFRMAKGPIMVRRKSNVGEATGETDNRGRVVARALRVKRWRGYWAGPREIWDIRLLANP
jgi:hypothetical protein